MFRRFSCQIYESFFAVNNFHCNSFFSFLSFYRVSKFWLNLYQPSGLLLHRSGIQKGLCACVCSEGKKDIKFFWFKFFLIFFRHERFLFRCFRPLCKSYSSPTLGCKYQAWLSMLFQISGHFKVCFSCSL